jgi:hypothetical protein
MRSSNEYEAHIRSEPIARMSTASSASTSDDEIAQVMRSQGFSDAMIQEALLIQRNHRHKTTSDSFSSRESAHTKAGDNIKTEETTVTVEIAPGKRQFNIITSSIWIYVYVFTEPYICFPFSHTLF